MYVMYIVISTLGLHFSLQAYLGFVADDIP